MEPTQPPPNPGPNPEPAAPLPSPQPVSPAPLPVYPEQPAQDTQQQTTPQDLASFQAAPAMLPTAQPVYAPAPVQPNMPVAATPAADEDHKDFVIAFLLSWLLGGFAADRFYLGYIKTGVLKVLTFGGLGIWVAIDIVRLAFGKLGDKHGLPLKGYEKNKKWTRILAVIHSVVVVLICLGIVFSLLITTKSGIKQKAYDTERKSDINALHDSLVVYNGLAFKYPTLADLNSADFRRVHMQGLQNETLKDPNPISSDSAYTLASAPTTGAYSYEPMPVGCDNSTPDNECTSYTLTAWLDSGATYVRQSQ
jgi:TM2 domain-containing membrane protein YozV/type II secretory pathway pseudopilin PulG